MVPVPTTTLYTVVQVMGLHSEGDMTLALQTKQHQTRIRIHILESLTLHREDTVTQATSPRHSWLELIPFHQQK